MINEIFDNSLELNYNPHPRSEFHYKVTPYSFSPELGKKIVLRSFTDMGQGLLQCIQEINNDSMGKKED